MSDLLKLAERVEAASGPDRGLDRDIFQAVAGGLYWPETSQWWTNDGWADRVPVCFTASIDAAMTLVDGFVLLHLSDIGADGLPLCRIGDPSSTPCGEWTGIASRLHLAVCAAALRARYSLLIGE